MEDATAFFVQFPHPGVEHNPRTDHMPWNTGDHGRKFLLTRGRYTDGGERLHDSDLVVWSEWEAPSTIERRWRSSGRLPRALHRPWWTKPGPNGPRQNTDPWVFGERMLYSNCRQIAGKNRRPNSMQRLTRGSVICFGSTIDGEFCFDTVFVVSSKEPWMPAEARGLHIDEAFRTCTAESVASKRQDLQLSLMLYRGATIDDPVEGMFSFVPAGLADVEDPRFARPSLESKYINPENRRSSWGSKRPLVIDDVRAAWESLRQRVVEADLLLGVSFETPDRRAESKAHDRARANDQPLPRTKDKRC